VVVDDGSTVPVGELGSDVRVLRCEASRGACAARNAGFKAACGRYVAFFDDDTELVEPQTLALAVDWLERIPRCQAVGFRQTDATGRTRGANPSDGSTPRRVNRFYSYGCLVTREALESLHGFREIFGYYCEEIELSLRILDCDGIIIFDPNLRVIHHEDPVGRNWKRISRLSTRNALLTVALDYPIPLIPLGVARALWNSVRDFRGRVGLDPLGKAGAVVNAIKLLPAALAERTPLHISTLVTYRSLGRSAVASGIPVPDGSK
jgi:GT2 family glycosyltransferase